MKKDFINKITASWEPLGEIPKVYENETYKMLKMQKLAYEALKNKPNVIINAPTAAGKTLAICWMNAKRLSNDPKLKAIISVPQTIIADGFRGSFNLSFEDNTITPWCPRHFLCSDNVPDNNIETVERFLSREGQISDINDRILVCSHASLVDAFQKYPHLFKNLIIVIDEAHHISYSEGEEIKDGDGRGAMVFCNQMGSIVATALKDESKNISLMLSTATLFRGDRLEIIPKKYTDRFETFHYPMDEYLKDCHWLKSFSYDFAMYNGSYLKRMTELFNDRIGKTIVYIPHVLSKRYSSGSKSKDWSNVYRSIAGEKNYKIRELDSGMILIKRGDKWIKVVNLADDSDMALRQKRKNLVIEAHKNKDNSSLDVIIALNMFKEGANWKWADREIIVGTKGSLTDMNQIVGRLFRDAQDKRHIQAIQLLPFSFDQIDKEGFRDNLNEYIKVVFATMLLDEVIKPLKISVTKKSINRGHGFGIGFVDYLRSVVKDENKIHSIQKEIMIEAISAQDNGEIDFGCNNKKSRDKFEKIVSDVLLSRGIKNHHKEISQQIHKTWIRESLKTVKGIDLDHVDFDAIQVNPLSFMLNYTTKMCGVDTFRKFREAVIEYCFVSYEEAKRITREAGIKSQSEYAKWKNRPKTIPKYPNEHYVGNGWIDWYLFLENVKKSFVKYEDAKIIVRNNGIKSPIEYAKWRSLPDNIPRCPDVYYKKRGWSGWADFLGTDWVDYYEAQKIVQKNGIKTSTEYKFWEDRPYNLPSSPNTRYKDKGWTNWPKFLGSERKPHFKNFHNYKNAKKVVKKYNIKSEEQYKKWNDGTYGLPVDPSAYYRDDGWTNWTEFWGNSKKHFVTYKEAQRITIRDGITSQTEYMNWKTRPKNLPASPCITYKGKGWTNWYDFLGKPNTTPIKKISYDDAKIVVRENGIRTSIEYRRWKNRPMNLSSKPDVLYKKQGTWISWPNFLGTE